jgi:predicted  nucleic acid-binding Zn-ribbon protein
MKNIEERIVKIEKDIEELKNILQSLMTNQFEALSETLSSNFEEIRKAQKELENLSKLLDYDNYNKRNV